MVGAGMSRNAEPTRPSRASMPTWADLVHTLIDRLHPAGSGTAGKREWLHGQAGATSTALRLAQEYTATFGRASLDNLVAQVIPDDEFEPGELHQLLLELPWSDVLTTNYDTLLERAAGRVFGQHYSVVRTPQEISIARRPRIVKLHGSLPSTRPFILTEDDFRTYPRAFAPFVNLAQQVAMESVLCLIGFSGDDPNFLHWTGWVRDNLGDYAPRVFLCGMLSLSNSERHVLHDRNVIPIDFSPLFSIESELSSTEKHRRALKWFLRSLQNGRPYDPLEWPIPPLTDECPPDGVPAPLPPPGVLPRRERWSENG